MFRREAIPAMIGEYHVLAERLAREAGRGLARREAEWSAAEGVSRRDIKLSADRLADAMIVDGLRSTGLPILSEEGGRHDGMNTGEFCWVVDPLDGSANFAKSLPLCCVSIALLRHDEPVMGVVYDFNRDEMFAGVVGEGASLNDAEIRVSSIDRAEAAILATGLPSRRDFSSGVMAEFGRSLSDWYKVRMLGSAALSLAYVASGRVDAYHEQSIMLWDVAAGCALVRAAGGVARISAAAAKGSFDVICANRNLMSSAFPLQP